MRPSSVYFSTTGMHGAAHLLGEHRHLDELGVLEAVADDRRVVRRHRRHGDQLRLGAGLEAEPVRPAVVEDLLDDLPLLVDLDRVDADVAALVAVLRDGRLERVVDVLEPVPQDVAEPDEDRAGRCRAGRRFSVRLLQVDEPVGLLRRVDVDVATLADREVALRPSGRSRTVPTPRRCSTDRRRATCGSSGWLECSRRS